MTKRRRWETVYKAVLLVLVILLASEPLLVAAQPREVNAQQQAIDSFTASGDVYLTHVAETLSLSAGLVNSVSAIQNTPLTQLSENAVSQTRASALQAAESSAIALGSIDDLATSIESLGGNLPAAFDPFQRAAEGLPQQLHDDLAQEAGLTSADVDTISTGMDDILLARQDMATNGMPAGIAAQLSQAGFSQTEIDQLATVAGTRGLADTTLTTSLAQFRASQDEWADVRTQMLILNIQLLGYQIGVRQASGIEPRAVTDAELQEIAQDELRLLVHVAHLQALWGSDPNLNVGEGDWWFIEHYAGRAAERLEALIIETQNRGLVQDLFVLQEMKLLALTAKHGDAEYVKAELDGLGQVLSFLVGDATFIARQRDELNGFSYVAARFVSHPTLRESVQWPVAQEATLGTAKYASLRMDTMGVENLAPLSGVIAEQNEANNTKTLLFIAGLPFFGQLSADIVAAATSIMSQVTPENYVIWVTAILTGDTDNPVLIAANIGFSLIPVLGAIPDIYSLVVDPSIFVKALSVFGIIGSLGDLIALIPFMQGIGGASFLGDAAAAVIKALFRNADIVFKAVLNGLKLTDAFNVILDFLRVTSHYVGSSIGYTLDEAIQFLQNLFTGGLNLWNNFVTFVRRVGAGTLLLMGFDEGSDLVGAILRRGGSLSDEALRMVDNIGDDMFKAGIELSDEAKDGVGVLAKNVDPEEALGFSDELMALCGAIGYGRSTAKMARLALASSSSDCVNQVVQIIGEMDEVAQQGLNKLCKSIGGDNMAALAKKYSGTDELANAFKKTLSLVASDPKFAGWTSKASVKTLDELLEFTSIYDDSYTRSLLTRLCDTDCTKPYFDEQFGNILTFIKNDEVITEMIGAATHGDIKNGIVDLLRKLNIPVSMRKDPYYQTFRGLQFELDRARKYYIDGNLFSVHESFITEVNRTRFYDIVLDTNVVVEAKYWSPAWITDNYGQLLKQIQDQARSNESTHVFVEFASTADNLALTDPSLVKLQTDLYNEFGNRVTIDIIEYVIH